MRKKNQSIEQQKTMTVTEVGWDNVREPGAYVEKNTGDLYRIPEEALITGASPVVHKESFGDSRLLLISNNPFVTTLEARLRCAQHNVDPNF